MTHIETLQAVSEAIASQVEHKIAARMTTVTVTAPTGTRRYQFALRDKAASYVASAAMRLARKYGDSQNWHIDMPTR